MAYGDKIPYEESYVIPAVGNSANAVIAAARLGLSTAFVTNLGADYYGTECLHVLEKEKVGTEFVSVHHNSKTNYHYVLWYKDDRTILIKHEKYNYRMPNIDGPGWIYLSSLGEHSEQFHDEIADYLESHPESKVAFQPGTFQMKMGKERLLRIYKRSDLFFCNKEEAEKILWMPEDSDVRQLLIKMSELGPKIVVITDGPKGAYAYDGKEMWMSAPYPDPKPPYERTGAGDAFSSTFTVAIAKGMSIKNALRWGSVNSMSVVQHVGAREGLLSRSALEDYLLQPAPDFVQEKIN
jgi:ribokinase